ncbi:glycerophosphoryl diester phosphodiesterase [Halorubrum aidingense JCM 13560]|uniref:Glycerophosphoryl diester phosphodiesterase n=1 Tax=Halorubrum aidingense JCM 13560 TaxID=1230454 RepID=M0PCT2_9EURY|nr:glycerophosphodiester phosphodiesterase [Halorubrum aidingense]EMA67673.1 glycerophosphoryl diester phosphodiesterase [Halorubrum aidingense JCM 13560]
MDDRAAAGDPTLIAHRGFAGENPENTVAAVERAADRRADWIEVDVMPTADGDVVVVHDAELSGRGERGLTDATGVVWETDTAAVTGAEVLDSGETVPLLAEVLDAVPPAVGVNVELKNPGRWDLRPDEKLAADALADRTAVWRPFVDRVLDATEGRDNDLLFSSFCEGALAAVRELSSLPVAPLVSRSVAAGLAIAREHEAAAIHPPLDAIRGTPFFDAERFGAPDDVGGESIVAAAHDEGRAVNVWTVETWHQADRLAAAGVDGVIADYSTLLRD